MNTYIISYDLAPGGDYNKVIEAIKEYKTWAHVTESTWAILTNKSSSEVRDELGELMPSGSKLFVVKSASEGSWRNVICSNEWLKKNL